MNLTELSKTNILENSKKKKIKKKEVELIIDETETIVIDNESQINIDIKNIPNEVPGFSFVKGECNPCSPFYSDYSCPFKLNVEGNNKISDVWKELWNV